VFKSQSENDRRQCAGPGAGDRQGDGDEEHQTNSLILLDDFSAAACPLEEPVQCSVEEAYLAQYSSDIVQEEQDKRHRQHVPDYTEEKGIVPVEVKQTHSHRNAAAQFQYRQGGSDKHYQLSGQSYALEPFR